MIHSDLVCAGCLDRNKSLRLRNAEYLLGALLRLGGIGGKRNCANGDGIFHNAFDIRIEMKSANARHVAGSLNALLRNDKRRLDSELRKRAGKKHRSDYAVGLGRSVRKKAESRDYIDKIALGKSFEKLLRKMHRNISIM